MAWSTATQSPSGDAGGGNCLSLSGGSPNQNFQACCRRAPAGKGSVDGVEYSYTCGKWRASSVASPPITNSARECAKLCTDADCAATSWASNGKCYFAKSGGAIGSASTMIMLERTGQTVQEPVPKPAGGCGEVADAAKTQCEQEKAASAQNSKAQCDQEKSSLANSAKNQCEQEKTASTQNNKAQCEQEKTSLADSARNQCEQEKTASAQNNKKQCEQEKSFLADNTKRQAEAQCQSQQEASKAQCEQEKNTLADNAKKQAEAQCQSEKATQAAAFETEKQKQQAALDELNQKLKARDATASSITPSASSSSSSTGANSPENKVLLEEISGQPAVELCLNSKYHAKKFLLEVQPGVTHEYMILCETWFTTEVDYDWFTKTWDCRPENLIEIIRTEHLEHQRTHQGSDKGYLLRIQDTKPKGICYTGWTSATGEL
ncbi:hypothetical protein N7541_009295 [Penicillium brevicompactum]|uniref:Apple domain-containing protein n=1 Tax=Penicillium brevicompactum TaxID=5074 RepID=A0A9W9QLE2_PENBR|nr:hypothetical protein N7541_009295 [Penicillium brevicompactum]